MSSVVHNITQDSTGNKCKCHRLFTSGLKIKRRFVRADDPTTDQMRSFGTDRPTKSNVPYTVDAGHFQYETDLVNFTHQIAGSVHTNTILVPNPTFKVGVTNNADLEVNIPIAGIHTFSSSTGPSSTIWGIGDTFVRAKVNLWGNDGGSIAAALITYVKAPSAPLGIGNGAVEEGLIAPAAFSLPNNFTLLLIPEVDALKNSADDSGHPNFIFDVNLSREVIKNVTAYAEFWADHNDDPVIKTTQLSFDTALGGRSSRMCSLTLERISASTVKRRRSKFTQAFLSASDRTEPGVKNFAPARTEAAGNLPRGAALIAKLSAATNMA